VSRSTPNGSSGSNSRLRPTVRSVTSREAGWSMVVVRPYRRTDIAERSGQR
jgi:hypothetical protein